MMSIGSGNLGNGLETTRRDFLKAGAVGLGTSALGLPGRDLLATTDPGIDRSVILLLLVGGPSQLETWDPKPDAPAEIRGPFGTIATECPGVRILGASTAAGCADEPPGDHSIGPPRSCPDS